MQIGKHSLASFLVIKTKSAGFSRFSLFFYLLTIKHSFFFIPLSNEIYISHLHLFFPTFLFTLNPLSSNPTTFLG